MPPLALRIEAVGDVPEELMQELAGFEARPQPDMTVLRGRVADTAALWGVLHRLHRARLELRSVESVDVPESLRPVRVGPAERVVRIELAGHAAGLVQMAVACDELYETPHSTTMLLRVTGEDDLFRVLSQFERLALDVRGIDVY